MIKDIKNWFEVAIPNPNKGNQRVQLGVFLEEVSEALVSLSEGSKESDRYRMAFELAKSSVTSLADKLKKNSDINVVVKDKKELLDALCDVIVTCCGVSHMYGFDIVGALANVNESNFSKFVDGKPIFNSEGKIIKGIHYKKPELDEFLGSDPTI